MTEKRFKTDRDLTTSYLCGKLFHHVHDGCNYKQLNCNHIIPEHQVLH
jgi:hypothetical protein